jgi:hypothetical protein
MLILLALSGMGGEGDLEAVTTVDEVGLVFAEGSDGVLD